jgi:hypothetical protein
MNRKGEAKRWMCGRGHVLGLVVRNGRGVEQLLLYRHAVDMSEDAPEQVDVIATVEGLVLDVRCDACGRIRTWTPGVEAMRRMLEHLEVG